MKLSNLKSWEKKNEEIKSQSLEEQDQVPNIYIYTLVFTRRDLKWSTFNSGKK